MGNAERGISLVDVEDERCLQSLIYTHPNAVMNDSSVNSEAVLVETLYNSKPTGHLVVLKLARTKLYSLNLTTSSPFPCS